MKTLASMVLCGVLAVGLAGCVTSSGPPAAGGDTCLPLFFTSPSPAHPGDTVTITTSGDCDVPAPEGGWELALKYRQLVYATATSPADIDADFSVAIAIPDDARPSENYIVDVTNWDYSSCDGSGSCASASVDLAITN